MTGRGAVFAQLGHWWGRELAGMLPAQLRSAFAGHSSRAVVHVSPEATRVQLFQPDGRTDHVFPPLEALTPSVERELSDLLQERTVEVAVPDSQVFCLETELPREARTHIRRAVAYQLTALAPINPEKLLFDASVADEGRSAKLRLKIAMARADYIEQLNTRWAALGLDAPSIGWSEAGQTALTHVFQRLRRPRLGSEQVQLQRLLMSLVVIVLATPAVIWGGASLLEAKARQDIDRLAIELKPKLLAQAESSRLADMEAKLDRWRARPQAVAALEAVAETLPKAYWISDFRFDARELRFRGIGGDGGQAVLALKRQPLLRTASLQSSSTDPAIGSRFEILVPLTRGAQSQ